jgi:predicted P-loop ATPase
MKITVGRCPQSGAALASQSTISRLENASRSGFYPQLDQEPRMSNQSEGCLIRNDWFTDRLSNLSSKEVIQEVAGVLIAELAELDILMRTKPAAYKAFLSRRHDRFRPVHGRHMVLWKRQCIFAGTVNPPDDGRYLNDQTGARRFWPVTCRGRIDIDALRRDRDQLWAEANFRYRRGDPWWLETEALERLAEAEQQARIVTVDPWLPLIRDWLGDRTVVAIGEALEQGLALPSDQHSDAVVKRVVKIRHR